MQYSIILQILSLNIYEKILSNTYYSMKDSYINLDNIHSESIFECPTGGGKKFDKQEHVHYTVESNRHSKWFLQVKCNGVIGVNW